MEAMEHGQFLTTRIYGYVPLLVPLVATGVRGRLLAPSAALAKHLSRDILTSLDHPVRAEGGLFFAICGLLRRRGMKRAMLMTIILAVGMIGARAEVLAAQCSSYNISEINLVSTADSEAGHVQTFVGFGPSKEEAEKNALGSCILYGVITSSSTVELLIAGVVYRILGMLIGPLVAFTINITRNWR